MENIMAITDSMKDDIRQKKLEEQSLHFLRFRETEVRRDMENVIRTIENYIFEYEESHPDVLRRNRRRKSP